MHDAIDAQSIIRYHMEHDRLAPKNLAPCIGVCSRVDKVLNRSEHSAHHGHS